MNKIAIFASGNGTNAENIILHFNSKKMAEVRIILSNNKDAFVVERARKLGVKTCVFSPSQLRESSLVDELLEKEGIEMIVLAGFLQLMPGRIVERYRGRIVNIHPALLPAYGGKGMFGMNVHKAVIEAKESESGITIHHVNEKFDDGAIIFQAKCAISKDDDACSLASKIAKLESENYPKVIEQLLTER